ncbi:MAG TPA: hypothetical protein VFH78_14405, partial [Candidatus Thermoplasmatota archaeon]|nr:hypothetical protein [Candidatus Thermoplasmatota archaeon]
MRHAAAVAPAFALALVLLLPVVEARMILSPNVLTVEAGGSAQFHVQLLNQGRQPLSFRVELDGDGLLTQVDRSSATIRAGDFVTLTVTVRALPWASGERVVRVVLYENDEAAPVETQEVRVQVVGGGPTALLAGGAAGAALGAGIGFALWRRWHLVALALYSRLRREHLERHPSRARLVEVVRASPGISLADAQRACGLPNGPFEHHLRKLVEAGRVVMVE